VPFVPDELVVRRVDAQEWELVSPVYYRGEVDGWVIPAGFRTDFASAPRAVVWLIPRFGIYTMAAVLHDWFCRVGIQAGSISAVDADGVFRRVLREQGVGVALRWLMWTGVRLSALTQQHRRPGWRSTAPAVIGLALLAVPLVAPPGLLVALALAVFRVVERVVGR
jgi:hypothetical protein